MTKIQIFIGRAFGLIMIIVGVDCLYVTGVLPLSDIENTPDFYILLGVWHAGLAFLVGLMFLITDYKEIAK